MTGGCMTWGGQELPLETLELNRCLTLSGTGLSSLGTLTWLTVMDCPCVSNEGVTAVAALPLLRSLELTAESCRDDLRLEILASATRLEHLYLDSTPLVLTKPWNTSTCVNWEPGTTY